jgi:hypothetical protein
VNPGVTRALEKPSPRSCGPTRHAVLRRLRSAVGCDWRRWDMRSLLRYLLSFPRPTTLFLESLDSPYLLFGVVANSLHVAWDPFSLILTLKYVNRLPVSIEPILRLRPGMFWKIGGVVGHEGQVVGQGHTRVLVQFEKRILTFFAQLDHRPCRSFWVGALGARRRVGARTTEIEKADSAGTSPSLTASSNPTKENHSLREQSVVPASMCELQHRTNDDPWTLRTVRNLHRCTDAGQTSKVLPLSATFRHIFEGHRDRSRRCVLIRISNWRLRIGTAQCRFLGVKKGRGRRQTDSATHNLCCCTLCLEPLRRAKASKIVNQETYGNREKGTGTAEDGKREAERCGPWVVREAAAGEPAGSDHVRAADDVGRRGLPRLRRPTARLAADSPRRRGHRTARWAVTSLAFKNRQAEA